MKITSNKRFSKHSLLISFICLAVVAHTGHAGNQQSSGKNKKSEPLLITLNSQKVQVAADGKETLLKADTVKPGDLVQYSASYHNRGKESITGLKAALPVPLGMEYVGKSAQPTSVLATAAGGQYAPEPLMRTVKDKDGKETQTPVPYSEYQNLRWEIGTLSAGEKRVVSARMRVNVLPKSAAELVAKPALSTVAKP